MSFTESDERFGEDQFSPPWSSQRPPAAVPHRPPPPTRAPVLWEGRWVVLLAAVLTGLAVGAYVHGQPGRYTARSSVQVSFLQSGAASDPSGTASGTRLATYAQLATADPVLDAARDTLSRDDAATLRASSVSAAPIAGSEVIGISVVSSDPGQSARQAVAVASALKATTDAELAAQLAQKASGDTAYLRSLDAQIGSVKAALTYYTRQARGDGPAAVRATAQLPSTRSLLGTLVTTRETVYFAPRRQLAQAQPVLTLMDRPTTGAGEVRHPFLEGLLAALVGGAVAALGVVAVGRRSR